MVSVASSWLEVCTYSTGEAVTPRAANKRAIAVGIMVQTEI